jgi:hypothetical protein
MSRAERLQKSKRARARRKEIKKVRETTIQKLYNKLKRKRNKLSKIKRRHHDEK